MPALRFSMAAFALAPAVFQPLYGPLSAGGDVAGELQAIEVSPIPNRLGHYLGNELIFALERHRLACASQIPA